MEVWENAKRYKHSTGVTLGAETVRVCQMKRRICQRLAMPLPELEAYYRERRKRRFELGKELKYIQLRKIFYPLFAKLLTVDRIVRGQTITVTGRRRKYKGQVIYACTHIGENDLENIYETIRQGCWWFVGDPCVLYKSISGLLLYLNGSIFFETNDKEDRRIAYLRAVELLKGGGALMIFPEGARNGTENLPVMELFPGTARMALETNTKIVPVAVEQYGRRFVINFGGELLPENFCGQAELSQELRDTLATLKWEIWEREPMQSRDDLPERYSELFLREFASRIYPYDTLETIERTRFHSRISSPQEAFAHLRQLVPCKENAFLFRESH